MTNDFNADCDSTPPRQTRRWRESFPAVLAWAAVVLLPCVLTGIAGMPNLAAEESKDKLDFLVARRELHDPFFEQSVVLMLPAEGMPLVVGLIVNKRTHVMIEKLYPKSLAPKTSVATAFFGGPVDFQSPSLIFHSTKAPKHAIPLFGDVYLTFDPDAISAFLRDPSETGGFRLVLGRAQWGPEQLHDEMRNGAWYRIQAEGDVIFDPDSEHLWRRLHERAQPHLDVENFLSGPSAAFLKK
jgi:putative AlgH/UPF0301 family transcriptional regulator